MTNQIPLYIPAGELERSPHCQAVWELLCASAEEFIPPLTQRTGTTQQNLSPDGRADTLPTAYFEELKQQDALLYVENGRLLGFLSFRPNYVAQVLQDPTPCAYVSTILVRPDARRKGITSRLYRELLEGRHHPNDFVSTRTWSENRGHLTLLEQTGFDLTLRIPNDRGIGIDTVYYRRSVHRQDPAEENELALSLWQKFKAYKLDTSVYAVIAMAVGSLVFVWMYLSPSPVSVAFIPELALAIATSLLASIFCLLAEMYIGYRSRLNDRLLEGLHAFGIRDLHFNKQELLVRMLDDCTSQLWVSGYRLILTRKITPYIARQIQRYRRLEVRVLLCPPWSSGYQLVYGEDDSVMDNYFTVLRSLQAAYGPDIPLCQVRFTQKPLFNDTYKFDKYLVTGPYLHAKTDDGGHITANDFFTYDVIRRSRLQELMEREYATLWDECQIQLDWEKFQEICLRYVPGLTEEEKTALLLEACCSAVLAEPLLSSVEAEYAP